MFKEFFKDKGSKDLVQIALLIAILILQVNFLIISFDSARKLSVSDITSIIQIMLIMVGFFVAYYHLIIVKKIEEKNKIWEKIHSLEYEYIGTKVIIIKIFLKFLNDTRSSDSELVEKYLIEMIKYHSNFQIKLEQIFDNMLYDTHLVKEVYNKFLEEDNKWIEEVSEYFFIALSADSKNMNFDEKLRKKGTLIVDRFRKKISSLDYVLENDNFKKFKEEVKLILS